MPIETKTINNALVVYLPEDFEKQILTESTESDLYQVIEKNINNKIIINLEHIKTISSLGLGIIVRVVKILWESGKRLSLCKVSNIIFELLGIVNLRDMLNIYDTEDDAINS